MSAHAKTVWVNETAVKLAIFNQKYLYHFDQNVTSTTINAVRMKISY